MQELRAAVVEDAAEAELARGSGETCIGDLELFVQANPYRERAWGQLMRALYQAGRPADALAAFGRARMILAVDLGIEPGPALREVEQAILTHDPSLVPNAAPRRELGRANLPAAVSPIVGRQLELTVLATMFAAERLITLTGVGGIGKTRLAIEIAAQSVGRHEVGPYFVDLAPIVDIDLVPAAVAAALGVHADPHEDVMTAVREAIADQQVVLLVDNCEHLLPKISGVVTAVLTSNPGVRILATSREQLGVAGEQVCPVDPLQVPPAGAAPDQVEVSDAGALFLARLPMNLATGPLSPDELAAVGRICRTLAGIPLGLELAAARCRTLSVSQLADRLDRWVGELAPLRHGVTPRHRTMAAALDWGFELLTPAAQVALQAMSVFAGGCDLAAFSTVCLDDSALPADDVLDELVRTSFVNVDFAADRTRYRLLEPVRQYASGHLATCGDSTERHRRHLDYYLDLARALTNDIDQVGFDTQWDGLRPELGNFRAALDWAATDRESTDAGLRLASRLFDLWTSDGHHDEGLSRTVAMLDSGAGSLSARSEAAYAAGFIAANVVGDVAQGVRLWEQALAEARAGADRLGEVRVRRVLSTCEFLRGDVVAARQHLETAIPIATAEGHELLHAYCGVALAQLLNAVGELDEATRQIESVLAGGAGSVVSAEIYARLELARTMFERGDYAQAVEATLRSLELAASHPAPQFELEAHLGLVELYCAVGDVAAAARAPGRRRGVHLEHRARLEPLAAVRPCGDRAASWRRGRGAPARRAGPHAGRAVGRPQRRVRRARAARPRPTRRQQT